MPTLLVILLPDIDGVVERLLLAAPTEAADANIHIPDVDGPTTRHLQDRYGKPTVIAVVEQWKAEHR